MIVDRENDIETGGEVLIGDSTEAESEINSEAVRDLDSRDPSQSHLDEIVQQVYILFEITA